MPGLTYSVIPRARPLCERCTSDTSPHAAHCRQDPPTSRVAPGVGPPPLQPALQKRTGCLRSSRLAARLPYRFPGPASFSLSLSLSLSLPLPLPHPLSPSPSLSFPGSLFAWVAFDSGKLCESMQPDEYMKGVVYFYTDFLLVCCCCLFAGVMSSAS